MRALAKTTPIESALWAGVLAAIERLPKETGGTSRTPGEFTHEGDTSGVSTTYTVDQPDGTSRVYAIRISVEESRDDHDSMWKAGGRADQSGPGERVVVDGEHYRIGAGKTTFRGFGGRRFDIEFLDGRKVTTRDLWHQGVIPPKWRERFPDNARFVTPAEIPSP